MDKYGFNNGNKNNPDFYFSNSEVTPPVNHKNNTTTNTKAKMKKKPSSGVGSTYLFFIIVIAVSVVISIYAIFCMNDIFAITKTKSNVTLSYSQAACR